MVPYLILFVTIILTSKFERITTFANNNYYYESEQKQEYCICVPFWQCKEDNSGIVDDTTDIIDYRFPGDNGCTGDYDVCCPNECGRRRKTSFHTYQKLHLYDHKLFNARIFGENNEAQFAEFPWMLGILENNVYRCGASLIHPQVALTAAHCVSGNNISNGGLMVRAGEWDWMNTTEPFMHQNRLVKEIILHPLYHPLPSLMNDIALLVLDYPFQLAENVDLTCLPSRNSKFDDTTCIATGWGKNSDRKGHYQSKLKKVELPTVPNDRCLKSLQDARLGSKFRLHESFVCAGGEVYKDTCRGDGGGPLFCPIQGRPGRYQQVGIVSWGLTCGMAATPGVYVNVGLFVEWIDGVMEFLKLDSSVYKY